MRADPLHGAELIAEIIHQKARREAFEVYWMAQANSLNAKGDGYMSLLPAPPRATARTAIATRTAQDIYAEVHQKLRFYMGKGGMESADI